MVWRFDGVIRQSFLVRLDLFLGFLTRVNNQTSGLLSRTRPVGSMVMWVAVLLATYLFLSFYR